MPSFGDFLTDVFNKPRPTSMSSISSQRSTSARELEPVLFPAAFGVSTGERFDDVAAIPLGLHIRRIKSITLHHAAWIDSIVTTYVLSDGSLFTCSNGPKGARTTTYDFAPNEILLAIGGLLGFIKDTDFIVEDLMLDYLQFHIKNVETGFVRIVPEDPGSYGSSQGADFFIQGPILAFSGRLAGYVSQLQPYLARERDGDFGLPAPGLPFDDYKLHRRDPIRRIKSITVRSAAWIDGIDVLYELMSGAEREVTHGGPGGVPTTTKIDDNEVLEAITISNSGPFPFCEALRFYFTRYGPNSQIIARRTVPDKSRPALGYEYEFGENLWIRAGKGNVVFAFAGRSGSYIEELSCWIRNIDSGEEKLVHPAKRAVTSARLSNSSFIDSGASPNIYLKPEESHRRSFSSLDVPLPCFPVSSPSGTNGPIPTVTSSPVSCLPQSLPSSPSLPVSLGRLSVCSSSCDPGLGSNEDTHSPRDTKRKRVSGQHALKWGDALQRQAQQQQAI